MRSRFFLFLAMRFCPGACGLPFLGEFSLAAWTNSSRRVFGTARTRRMTALKCANSGVDSNAAGFITSCANLDALAALLSVARTPSTVGVLRFAGELIVRHSPTDDLFHDGGKA